MSEKIFKPRANVQKRIEEAAMHLISTTDSSDLSFGDIANAAHCSLQTLYNYYGNIENLWIACGGRVLKSLSNRLIDHLQGLEDTKERYRKAFWIMLDFFERHERSVTVFMSNVHLQSWMQDDSFHQPEVNRIFLDMIEEGQKSGQLTSEVDKIAILDIVYGVLTRLVQMREIRRDKVSNAERSNVIFEMVWRAIANPNTTLPKVS